MKRRPSHQRNGVVLVTALVCLLIVMAMIATMIQGTLRNQRQLSTQHDARQTELLLQAGIYRAASRLAQDADYMGETWKLPAEAFSGSGEALVTITVSRESNESPLQIKVTAEYPAGSEWSIRRSDSFTLSPSQVQE